MSKYKDINLLIPADQLQLIIMNSFASGRNSERNKEDFSVVEYGKMYMERYVEEFSTNKE